MRPRVDKGMTCILSYLFRSPTWLVWLEPDQSCIGRRRSDYSRVAPSGLHVWHIITAALLNVLLAASGSPQHRGDAKHLIVDGEWRLPPCAPRESPLRIFAALSSFGLARFPHTRWRACFSPASDLTIPHGLLSKLRRMTHKERPRQLALFRNDRILKAKAQDDLPDVNAASYDPYESGCRSIRVRH
ncbi:hypothetical protein EDB86DRAFT_2925592 [Lactarius hatsudake]|nr:hypothetical protein EDB86DRAFT_2925592 [Lactarius hatsudake]